MIIKKFEAPTSTEALRLVKDALGDKAVILSNKTLDKGGPNQRFEIMAAMDYDLSQIAENDNKQSAGARPDNSSYSYSAVRKKNRPQTSKAQAPEQFLNLLRKETSNYGPTQPKIPEQPLIRPGSKKPNKDEVQQWRDRLINDIQACPIDFTQKGPTIIALVGPTGVGKTTTAAKIAAWYHLQENKRVTLLTMDCYRIGATDQLRTYAKIMNLPCEVAVRKSDLAEAVSRHENSDLIIIDTAGKSPFDPEHINELQEWFSPIADIKPLLLLSATTKKEDLNQIVATYEQLAPSSLILTKLDETRTYATLCQQVAKANVPVGYLTMGQRVPEDFLVAEKPFLADFFKQGWSAIADQVNA